MRTLAVVTLAVITSTGCVSQDRTEGARSSAPTVDPVPSRRPVRRTAIRRPAINWGDLASAPRQQRAKAVTQAAIARPAINWGDLASMPRLQRANAVAAMDPRAVPAIEWDAVAGDPSLQHASAVVTIRGPFQPYEHPGPSTMSPGDIDALDRDLTESLDELIKVIEQLDVVINDGQQLQQSLVRWLSRAHGGQATEPGGP
jgi:hypothetical protein